MPTKDSQKTEDMLDQTFANFDTEVTGAQTQDTPAGGGAVKQNGGAKKSSNMAVFIGAGVAAVGAVAYLFVIKPMLQNNQAPVETVAQAPATQQAPEVVQTTPTVEVPVTAPGVVPVDPTAQAQTEPAIDPLTAQMQATQQAPVVETPVNDPSVTSDVNAQLNQQLAQKAAETVTPTPTPTAPVAAAVTPASAQPVVANTPANVQSVAVVDDLKSMFDKQTTEFRTVLTDMDTRVVALEGSMAEQKEINQKVDQRLGALEGMKKSSPPKAKKTRKAKVKKVAAVEPKEDVSKKNMDSSILVDNSVPTPKVKEKEAVASNLPKLNVHSIYGGRLWVKNGDGSLSTYTSGDRLPSGETIKAIDDEKFEVTTNKRVIKS